MPVSSEPVRPLVFFGHHKVATSWVIKIFSDLGYLNGFRLEVANTAGEVDDAMLERLQAGKSQVLAFRNADPVLLPQLGSFLGFHLIRDPRDLLVSSYFSHRNSHSTANWPELEGHRESLCALMLQKAYCWTWNFVLI